MYSQAPMILEAAGVGITPGGPIPWRRPHPGVLTPSFHHKTFNGGGLACEHLLSPGATQMWS